jgi:uroporphyrinogen-III decarboxylase
VGTGRQQFVAPYALRLRGVELVCQREGEVVHREPEPTLPYFPALWAPEWVARDRPNATEVVFATAVGRVRLRWVVSAEVVSTGVEPYLAEHLVKEEADWRIVEPILERTEVVPQYDRVWEAEQALDRYGLVVPDLHRIPFQQLLLEYLGEVGLFYALHDSPARVRRLLDMLDRLMLEILRHLANPSAPYVEFLDNLDGVMTNPKLFAEYCLPAYQRYTGILHQQGKRVGSHTDGNLKPLLGLLAESGLDVCESFSPAPLTPCTLEEALAAWENGPTIWGGFPSPLLEERTPEDEFHAYLERVLDLLGTWPAILGVGDAVLGNNLIERVRAMADRIRERARH